MAPASIITKAVSARAAFTSESALDNSEKIIGLGREMNGSSFGVDTPANKFGLNL